MKKMNRPLTKETLKNKTGSFHLCSTVSLMRENRTQMTRIWRITSGLLPAK